MARDWVGNICAKEPVRKKVPGASLAASVARIEATPSALAPASNVNATTFRVVGRSSRSTPRKLAGTAHDVLVDVEEGLGVVGEGVVGLGVVEEGVVGLGDVKEGLGFVEEGVVGLGDVEEGVVGLAFVEEGLGVVGLGVVEVNVGRVVVLVVDVDVELVASGAPSPPHAARGPIRRAPARAAAADRRGVLTAPSFVVPFWKHPFSRSMRETGEAATWLTLPRTAPTGQGGGPHRRPQE